MIQYLPGVLFLAGVSAGIAAIAARYAPNRRMAMVGSVVASTAVLKTWAYVSMGGFDARFLAIVIGVAVTTSIVVVPQVATRRVAAP